MDERETGDLNEYFTFLSEEEKEESDTTRESISRRKHAWSKFKADRAALLFLIIIILIMVASIAVPEIFRFEYDATSLINRNRPPSEDHWFGTDHLGRDMFTRVFLGARNSFIIAIVSGFISVILGVLYGAFSGFLGHEVDFLMVKFLDILKILPNIIYVILFTIFISMYQVEVNGVTTLIIAFCLTFWIDVAKVIRDEVSELKNYEFIVAAKALGIPSIKILFKHLIPNTSNVAFVNLTLIIPQIIFFEVILSYIGLGLSSSSYISLGTLTSDTIATFRQFPLQMLFPTAMACIIILSFYVISDALRKALDYKVKY